MNSTSRSYSYQWKLQELPWDYDSLCRFSQEHTLHQVEAHKEEMLDLKMQLRERFWQIAKTSLTPLQYEVVCLTAQGLTQVEIAKKLEINQSSVQKTLYGQDAKYSSVMRYHGKAGVVFYGGAIKKLKKLLLADPAIQDLLGKISELSEQESYGLP